MGTLLCVIRCVPHPVRHLYSLHYSNSSIRLFALDEFDTSCDGSYMLLKEILVCCFNIPLSTGSQFPMWEAFATWLAVMALVSGTLQALYFIFNLLLGNCSTDVVSHVYCLGVFFSSVCTQCYMQ